ncbi:hypothetical protein ABIE67_010279 [Streptomyces sp. V4I8]|uniref:hypothetical protein n=1 Tax=Streptomyces sp. V4I8 TaxID=3156469 RepID=UPI0035111A24
MDQVSAAQLLDRVREARDYAREKERESFTAHDSADSSFEALVATMDGAIHRVVADVLDVVLHEQQDS